MDASKVTVSADTLRFQKMDKGRKTKLRRQNIIDLIKSKAYGTPITLAEFGTAAQLTASSAYSLIETMVKNGVISKDKLEGQKYAYRVNGAVWVSKKPETAQVKPLGNAAELARDFYWQTGSDSLHEFVQWLEHGRVTHATNLVPQQREAA
ncbi:MAG: hypothetical protein KGL39_53130 [Patescibacteria group bacterium]|nr:hypothetical protein [Patescibacteria group bacterium]